MGVQENRNLEVPDAQKEPIWKGIEALRGSWCQKSGLLGLQGSLEGLTPWSLNLKIRNLLRNIKIAERAFWYPCCAVKQVGCCDRSADKAVLFPDICALHCVVKKLP